MGTKRYVCYQSIITDIEMLATTSNDGMKIYNSQQYSEFWETKFFDVKIWVVVKRR